MDQRFISLSNQQQLDCLFKHIEQSQDLNLWKKQTQQQATTSNSTIKREKRIQFITPNSSPPPHTLITHEQSTFPEPSISCSSSSQLTTTRTTQEKSKSEWVVLPVFIDIVKLALKTRDDCSTRQVTQQFSHSSSTLDDLLINYIILFTTPTYPNFTCNQITKWIDKSLCFHRNGCNCVGVHESHDKCQHHIEHRRRHSWTRLYRQSYSDVSP